MNLALRVDASMSLVALVDRAAAAFAGARTSAEVLEARDLAGIAYDVAKKTARIGKAKKACDELIAAAHRAQADALELEAGAKRRLADEYDAAQERGEVAAVGKPINIPAGNNKPTVSNIGLSSKAIHEAREIRDAEQAEPGVVRRALDKIIEAGEEPTRAKVKRAVKAKSKRQRRPRHDPNFVAESQHDRDLKMLFSVWEAACASAREEFLSTVQ